MIALRTVLLAPGAITSGMPVRTTIFAAWIFDFIPPTAVSLDVPPASFSTLSSMDLDDRKFPRVRLPEIFHHAIDAGENHQQVRGQQCRDERGKFIVVAELQLRGRDGVVLIDDRNHAALQQRGERVARVAMTLFVLQIGVGEQHLRDMQVVFAEKFFVQSP